MSPRANAASAAIGGSLRTLSTYRSNALTGPKPKLVAARSHHPIGRPGSSLGLRRTRSTHEGDTERVSLLESRGERCEPDGNSARLYSEYGVHQSPLCLSEMDAPGWISS